jgi:hypothetical protein
VHQRLLVLIYRGNPWASLLCLSINARQEYHLEYCFESFNHPRELNLTLWGSANKKREFFQTPASQLRALNINNKILTSNT